MFVHTGLILSDESTMLENFLRFKLGMDVSTVPKVSKV